MVITATELKTNLSKYLKMAAKNDIFISKNGKIIAQLSFPQSQKLSILQSLIGFANNDEELSLNEIKKERLCGE